MRAAALLVVLCACVSAETYRAGTAPVQPTADRAAMFKRALLAIGDAGLAVQDKDEGVFQILTEWAEEAAPFGNDKSRTRLRITIVGDSVRVEEQCQGWIDSPFARKWEDCGDRRKEGTVDRLDRLARQIAGP